MRATVKLVASIIGRSPATIEADPRELVRIISQKVSFGVEQVNGRWINRQMLFRSALRLVGTILPGSTQNHYLPEWQPLVRLARKHRSQWQRVSQLVHWLSDQGIPPQKVQIGDLEKFKEQFLADAFRRRPRGSWAEMRGAWQYMQSVYKEWPAVAIDTEQPFRGYSLEWDSFPDSLLEDVEHLLQYFAGNDPSRELPQRNLRASSLTALRYSLRAFASALVHSGCKPQHLKSLADCLTIENYRAGMDWIYRRGGSEPTAAIRNMATRLKFIAQQWTKPDPATLDAMANIIRRIKAPEKGLSEKIRQRLRPFSSEQNMRDLVNLPDKIRSYIETTELSDAQVSSYALAATAIEILVSVPLRVSILSSLEFKRHFVRVGRNVHLKISKDEVSNGLGLEFELPEHTVQFVDWYVKNHRVTKRGNPYLFPNGGIGPMGVQALRAKIKEVIFEFTGHTVNPHLFRHISATAYLRENNSGYEVVRRTLGQKRLQTSIINYRSLEESQARQDFARIVGMLGMKAKAKKTSKPNSKRRSP